MRFANRSGQSFDLTLSKFEPPNREWVVVVGEVHDGSRQWRFEDPCLMASEVRLLAKWLRRIADGKSNRSEIDFLEPNLAFKVVGQADPDITIRVVFELEG